ncbi:unnamed protein product, partial [Allacma fusca]
MESSKSKYFYPLDIDVRDFLCTLTPENGLNINCSLNVNSSPETHKDRFDEELQAEFVNGFEDKSEQQYEDKLDDESDEQLDECEGQSVQEIEGRYEEQQRTNYEELMDVDTDSYCLS